MAEQKRVQVMLDTEDALDLERLAHDTRQNQSDVMRSALTLYGWAVQRVAEGGKLQLVPAKGDRETVLLPGLRQGPGEAGK